MEIALLAEWPVCPVGVKASEKRLADTESSSRTGDFGLAFITARFCRHKDIRLSTFSSYPRDFQHDTFVRETIAACSAASAVASLADTRYLFKADS